MKEAYVYLGHSIDLNLVSSRNHWGYTYFIDTKYCFESTTELANADAARMDALTSAHSSIARLQAMSSSTADRAAAQDH